MKAYNDSQEASASITSNIDGARFGLVDENSQAVRTIEEIEAKYTKSRK
jgi:hypothetical protein